MVCVFVFAAQLETFCECARLANHRAVLLRLATVKSHLSLKAPIGLQSERNAV